MKSDSKNIFLVLAVIFFSAAVYFLLFDSGSSWSLNNNSSFKKVTVADEFTVELPVYLRPIKDLQPYTLLHYENLGKEVFVVVERNELEHFKKEGDILDEEAFELAVTNYRELQEEALKKNEKFSDKNLSPMYSLDSLSLLSRYYSIETNAKARHPSSYIMNVFYLFNGKIYVMTLITNKNFKDKYEEIFLYIMRSFKVQESKDLLI